VIPDIHGTLNFNLMKQVLDTCSFFPSLDLNRDQLHKLIHQLEQGYEDVNRPLRILLVGGTGVGKSTLLNALAGENISQTGHIRPTTNGFTVYINETDDDPWINTLENINIKKHQHEKLKRKIIIDAPDADSAVIKHRQVLEKALALADLVLVIVTVEKYVSKVVLHMITRFCSGRRFVFVMNKTDIGKSSELDEDLKKVTSKEGFSNVSVFLISARNVLLNNEQAAKTLYEGDFSALEEFIKDELTNMHIREIHRLNLKERSEMLANCIISSLPDDYSRVGERWLDNCETEMHRFLNDLSLNLDRMFVDSEEFISALVSKQIGTLTGPFGFVAGLICTLRSIARQELLTERTIDIRSFVDRHLDADRIQALNQGMDRLKSACISAGKNQGISEELLNRVIDNDGETRLGKVSKWLQTQAETLIAGFLRNKTRMPGGIVSGMLNIPALSWLGYWIYRLIKPIFQSKPIPFEAVPGAFLVLLVILSLEWYLVDIILKRINRFKVKRMVSDAQAELTHRFRAAFTPRIEATSREISRNVNKLDLLIKILMQ